MLLLVLIPIISQATAFLSVPTRTTTCRLQSHPEHISQLLQDINTEGAAAKAILLDVRELDEWTAGHLQSATPAPLSVLTSGQWMDTSTGKYYAGTFPIDRRTGVAIVKNVKIYLIHDNAKQAAELFAKMGYSNVVALSENYEELAAKHGVSSIATGGVDRLTDDNG